jgi:hypothetical protein
MAAGRRAVEQSGVFVMSFHGILHSGRPFGRGADFPG